MLRNLLAAMLLVGFAASASAQGLYVRASGSYQIGAAKGNVLAPYNPFSFSYSPFEPLYEGSSGSFAYVNDSYGEGIYAGIGVGYMLNEYIGFDLGIGYLFGSENDVRYDFGGDYEETLYSFNMLGITPSLVLNAPLGDNLSLTSRNGIFIGFSPTLEITNEYSGVPVQDYEHITEVEGSLELGFQSSIGLALNLSEAIAVSFDVTYTGVRFVPEEGEVTSFTIDGSDAIDFLDPEDRSFTYEETISGSSNSVPSFQVSASSIGFGFGIKYTFGK